MPDSPGAIQILPPWVSTIAREIARPRPALVEVVAGDHGRMGLTHASASRGSHLRLTRSDSSASRESANIFPPTFENRSLGVQGERFFGSRERETALAELFSRHLLIIVDPVPLCDASESISRGTALTHFAKL